MVSPTCPTASSPPPAARRASACASRTACSTSPPSRPTACSRTRTARSPSRRSTRSWRAGRPRGRRRASGAGGRCAAAGASARPPLSAFVARGPAAWAQTRERVGRLLSGVDAEPPLHRLDEVELLLPFAVADYVDFWSAIEHASNSGRIFRPGSDPLPPNWRHMPIGYHGRSGTVVVSGTPVRRPAGQSRPDRDAPPVNGPSAKLDVELELGFVIGTPSAHGAPVAVGRALDHVFGVVLLNDWSARDLQAFESQPLGPFLGKSFATSISAWVTPMAALAPFRAAPRPPQEPTPAQYLREEPWALDVALAIELNGETIARTNARHLYWSVAQQIAHLTVNGASLRTGDLLGSGTISGPG